MLCAWFSILHYTVIASATQAGKSVHMSGMFMLHDTIAGCGAAYVSWPAETHGDVEQDTSSLILHVARTLYVVDS